MVFTDNDGTHRDAVTSGPRRPGRSRGHGEIGDKSEDADAPRIRLPGSQTGPESERAPARAFTLPLRHDRSSRFTPSIAN